MRRDGDEFFAVPILDPRASPARPDRRARRRGSPRNPHVVQAARGCAGSGRSAVPRRAGRAPAPRQRSARRRRRTLLRRRAVANRRQGIARRRTECRTGARRGTSAPIGRRASMRRTRCETPAARKSCAAGWSAISARWRSSAVSAGWNRRKSNRDCGLFDRFAHRRDDLGLDAELVRKLAVGRHRTRPPGKTSAPAANAMPSARSTISNSGGAPARSRTTMSVAAGIGVVRHRLDLGLRGQRKSRPSYRSNGLLIQQSSRATTSRRRSAPRPRSGSCRCPALPHSGQWVCSWSAERLVLGVRGSVVGESVQILGGRLVELGIVDLRPDCRCCIQQARARPHRRSQKPVFSCPYVPSDQKWMVHPYQQFACLFHPFSLT